MSQRTFGRIEVLLLAPLLAPLLALILAIAPSAALAQVHAHPDAEGTPVVRSLESLRDLDDQSWQVVAYREGPPGGPLRLRIVGYPGKVRLDHPTALEVRSGRLRWDLEDVTLASAALARDNRAAAAEFDLAPLLADLERNRPLRLRLPRVFSELAVPPYVVAEWRSLPDAPAP
ncbi:MULTISPECIES: DUF3122 domain-containing protein [unclassified Synechococcus]|uniref:DUF3122 domain-containing protein n=1 Tax=unclassified Synechococcus TaxID=2626047 RepID=UPI001C22A30E|nr:MULTISPECIES: DUF3122 domain-containing protein [unclassified Synechococcus]